MSDDWLTHPVYAAVRDDLINRFRKKKLRFKRLKKLVFLCGGAGSLRRDTLAKYIRKNRSDALVFYAEDAWNVLSKEHPEANALELEDLFAQLADIVAIVVESPG